MPDYVKKFKKYFFKHLDLRVEPNPVFDAMLDYVKTNPNVVPGYVFQQNYCARPKSYKKVIEGRGDCKNISTLADQKHTSRIIFFNGRTCDVKQHCNVSLMFLFVPSQVDEFDKLKHFFVNKAQSTVRCEPPPQWLCGVQNWGVEHKSVDEEGKCPC